MAAANTIPAWQLPQLAPWPLRSRPELLLDGIHIERRFNICQLGTVATDVRPANIPDRRHLSKTGEFVATNAKRASTAMLFDGANKGHTWNVIKGLVANSKGELIGKIGAGSDAAYAAVNGFQVVSSGHK